LVDVGGIINLEVVGGLDNSLCCALSLQSLNRSSGAGSRGGPVIFSLFGDTEAVSSLRGFPASAPSSASPAIPDVSEYVRGRLQRSAVVPASAGLGLAASDQAALFALRLKAKLRLCAIACSRHTERTFFKPRTGMRSNPQFFIRACACSVMPRRL
jgi:hypothetical protein